MVNAAAYSRRRKVLIFVSSGFLLCKDHLSFIKSVIATMVFLGLALIGLSIPGRRKKHTLSHVEIRFESD